MRIVLTTKKTSSSALQYNFMVGCWTAMSNKLNINKSFPASSKDEAEDFFRRLVQAEEMYEKFKPVFLSYEIYNNWVVIIYKSSSLNDDLEVIDNVSRVATSITTVDNIRAIEESLPKLIEMHGYKLLNHCIDVTDSATLITLPNVIHMKCGEHDIPTMLGMLIGYESSLPLTKYNSDKYGYVGQDGRVWNYLEYTVVPSNAADYEVAASDIKPDDILVCGFSDINKVSLIKIREITSNKETIFDFLQSNATIASMEVVKEYLKDKVLLRYNTDKSLATLTFLEDLEFMDASLYQGQCLEFKLAQ